MTTPIATADSITACFLKLTIVLILARCSAFSPSLSCNHHATASAAVDSSSSHRFAHHYSRRDLLFTAAVGITIAYPFSNIAYADDISIEACPKVPSGKNNNCVSTASVKQVDLYAAPWVYSGSADEMAARLKGVIASDGTLELMENESNRYFKVRAARTICFDEIEFIINEEDRIILFRSQQAEGPDVSDFGAIRKRLEEIRKRLKLEVMGAELTSADAGPREGVGDQLKAFWGLQSGGGYESVLLDEDE